MYEEYTVVTAQSGEQHLCSASLQYAQHGIEHLTLLCSIATGVSRKYRVIIFSDNNQLPFHICSFLTLT